MKISCHLIVNRRASVRLTKGNPGIDSDEIAIRLDLDVPDRYFARPYPVVAIQLPDPSPVDTDAVLEITAKTLAGSLGVSAEVARDGLREMLNHE